MHFKNTQGEQSEGCVLDYKKGRHLNKNIGASFSASMSLDFPDVSFPLLSPPLLVCLELFFRDVKQTSLGMLNRRQPSV